MNLTEELERLAHLRQQGALTESEFQNAKTLLLSGGGQWMVRSVRRQSERKVFGLPLWAIALGPDLARGELRGHARGIIAIGDIATGWLAFGGLARGFLAIGGLAVGVLAIGGCAVGALAALGGLAIGGIAIGGGAIGGVAIGGGACGYYALGSGAIGAHIVSVSHQDPEALEYFRKVFPFLRAMHG
jgi:hypothetical protein